MRALTCTQCPPPPLLCHFWHAPLSLSFALVTTPNNERTSPHAANLESEASPIHETLGLLA